jgi:hypothetical protein
VVHTCKKELSDLLVPCPNREVSSSPGALKVYTRDQSRTERAELTPTFSPFCADVAAGRSGILTAANRSTKSYSRQHNMKKNGKDIQAPQEVHDTI